MGLLQQDAGPDPSHGQGPQGLRENPIAEKLPDLGEFFVHKKCWAKGLSLAAYYDIINTIAVKQGGLGMTAVSFLFVIAIGILCLVFGIRMFGLVIAVCFKKPKEKPEQPKRIVVVEDEESEIDRQNREYGDFYGDSYYW